MIQKIFYYYKNLIWTNRFWFLVIIIIFTLGSFFGVLFAILQTGIAKQLILGYAKSIPSDLRSGWEITLYIFQRNLLISVVASGLSFFLGLAAVIVTFVNGFLLGLLFGYPGIYSSANPFYLIALVLPHGIFEYFATFTSLAFGLRLGLNWILPRNKNKRTKTFFKNLQELLTVLLFSSIFLFFAALIEGFLTKDIADCLFGNCGLGF